MQKVFQDLSIEQLKKRESFRLSILAELEHIAYPQKALLMALWNQDDFKPKFCSTSVENVSAKRHSSQVCEEVINIIINEHIINYLVIGAIYTWLSVNHTNNHLN